jgi:hypothetical protein
MPTRLDESVPRNSIRFLKETERIGRRVTPRMIALLVSGVGKRIVEAEDSLLSDVMTEYKNIGIMDLSKTLSGIMLETSTESVLTVTFTGMS